MDIFVAAKWEEKEAARAMMQFLEDEGHTIVHDWTVKDPDVTKPDNLQEYLMRCAIEDYEGVAKCSALVMICHPKGRGMFVEEGIAIARAIPVIILDRDLGENIYFHMPNHFTVVDKNDVAVTLQMLEDQALAPMPALALASG